MNCRIIPILLLASATISLHAQIQIVTDDFNDSSKDGAKWGADFNFTGTGGQLTETSQRLEFEQPSAAITSRVRPWISTSPTYSQDWEAILEVNNEVTFGSQVNGGSSIVLAVQNPLNQSQAVTIELFSQNFTGPGKGFHCAMVANGNEIGEASSGNINISHGFVRLTFDSNTKVIRAYHRVGGNWTQLGSFGIAGNGGSTANDSWGMSNNTQFGFGIVGSVWDAMLTVPAGAIYADNFQLALNTQDSTPTLNTDLTGHWPLASGQAGDQTTNANHGTIVGAVPTTGYDGTAQGAFLFDGSGDEIRMDDIPAYTVPGDMAVSVWIKPGAASVNGPILTKYNSGANTVEWDLEQIGTEAQFGVFKTGSNAESGRYYRTVGASLAQGTWHHFAASYDYQTAVIRIWINGVESTTALQALNGQTAGISTIYDGPEAIRIGAVRNFSQSLVTYNGAIDEVRFYKRAFRDVDVAFLSSPHASPTAADLVAEGRVALAAKDLSTARARFAAALVLDPNRDDANALMAITRLLDLPNQPTVQAFLNRLGVSSTGRDVYAWNAKPARDPDGDLTVPSGLSGAEFSQHWRTNAVPEISAAIANLAKVTNQSFLLNLTAAETTFEPVDVDLGDLLILRAGLHVLEYFSYTFLIHNFDAQFSVVDTFAQNGPFDVAQFLSEHPQLLTFATTNDLAAGRRAFANAADRYAEGSQFLRNRTSGLTRLFNFIEGGNNTDEQQFREVLEDLRTSLDGTVAVRHAEGAYTLFAGALFTGNGALRTFLPQFQRDRVVVGTLPDPTFGGLLIGRTSDEVEEFLFSEDHLQLSGLPTVPRIANPNTTGGSPISFTAKTKPGQGYLVEASNNFTNWSNVGAFIALDLNTPFTESKSGLTHQFYRLQDVGDNVPTPANANFANRIGLGNGTVNTTGYNRNAFSEGGEPNFGFNRSFRTVWYQWTPAATGNYRIKVIGRESPHPIYAVCTGSGLGNLSVLVNGFPSSTGQVFNASVGQTYFVVVDGQFSSFGSTFFEGGFRVSISAE